MPKVSVIIPIYGVEKYIERCAESLFHQTLDDIEYIFIDDCTLDNSMEILNRVIEKYPHRQSQIKVERMPQNGGLAAVRKYGIIFATGEYIIHCDSDDWVDIRMYELLYNHAIQKDSDLVICDYIITKGDRSSERLFRKNITDCSREALLKRLLTSSDLNPIWTALVKRNLYDNIMYPIGAMSEDKTFMMQFVWMAKNVSYLSEALYYYFLSDTSILRTVNKEANIRKFKQVVDNRYIILNFFNRENIIVPQQQLDAFLFMGKNGFIESFLDDPECKELWIKTYPIPIWRVLINPYINMKSRIKYLYTILKQKYYRRL